MVTDENITVSELAKEIAKQYEDEHSVMYIHKGLVESNGTNSNLEIDIKDSKIIYMQGKKEPTLSIDSIDDPVKRVRTIGGWDKMCYYVNI